jgi:hypothetical protein
MKDPETPEQWQAAVDMIVALLYMDSSQSVGLAAVNVQRCAEILHQAKALGYKPSERHVARLSASVSGSRALLAEVDAHQLSYPRTYLKNRLRGSRGHD